MADLAKIKRNVAKMASMNAPESDIDSYIASEGVTVDDVRNFKMQQPIQPMPQKLNPIEQIGASQLGQAIGQAIDETGNIIKNIPNQNPASSALQILGQGAKIAGAPAGQIMGAMVSPLQAPAQSMAASIDETGAGQFIGDKLMQARNLYNQFAQENPELSKDIGAAANIIGTLQGGQQLTAAAAPIAQKIPAVLNKVESAAQKFPGLAGETSSGVSINAALGNVPATVKGTIDSAKNMAKIGVTSTDELGAAASQFYKAADDASALLKPEAIRKAAASIKSKVLQSTPEGKIFGGNTIVDDFLGRLDKISDTPVSLKGLDEIDTALQDAIGTASRSGDKVAIRGLKEIRNGLRNASSNANPSDIVNPQAFQAWRDGDMLYAARMKSKQIDDIIKNAYNQQVPSTGIKTGFRQLAKSIDKYGNQGWTPEEITAIRRAAKSGLVGGALSTVGGRLMSGIAGTAAGFAGGGMLGAPIGLVAGEAAGFPLRASANAIQKARATQVQRLLGDRPEIANLMNIERQKAALRMKQQKLTGQ